MNSAEESQARLQAIRVEITPKLNEAFDHMERDDPGGAAQVLLQAVEPSVGHLVAALSLLAASSAALLQDAIPINKDNGDYYGFMGFDPDAYATVDLSEPMTWSARYLTSACNLDAEQAWALTSAMLDTNDEDFMIQCLLSLFVQAWHVHTGHTSPIDLQLGSKTMKGLAITPRDTEN
jgi:hypothetical protein